MERLILVIHMKNGEAKDVDVPDDISADQLITALAEGLPLKNKPKFLMSAHPAALLTGSRTLVQYGIRSGTDIYI